MLNFIDWLRRKILSSNKHDAYILETCIVRTQVLNETTAKAVDLRLKHCVSRITVRVIKEDEIL